MKIEQRRSRGSQSRQLVGNQENKFKLKEPTLKSKCVAH